MKKKKNFIYNIGVIKNDLSELKKNINTGMYLFRNNKEHITKICSDKNCVKLTCSKECWKNELYKSFWNFNRGIKTIYNILFKLLLTYQLFRIQCKCCENITYLNYLYTLDKKFASSQKISTIFETTQNNFEPKKNLELNINFLINKFMGTLGILDCECKFKNKYHSFYTSDYLNYSNIIKVYMKTIPFVIKLLKTYFEIKDNHEELVLVDDDRCIHEDIRYNNLTFCSKKKYHIEDKKYLIEMIMKLDLVNTWVIDSIKITNILLNQQSLEYFMFYSKTKPTKLITKFNKIYNPNNNFLDLNYMSNKNNIIKTINLFHKKFDSNEIDKLFMLIYKQLMNRNKLISNYNVNTIIINYIYETINFKNIQMAFKWLEYVKNIKKNDLNEQTIFELEKIFNSLLDTDVLNINTKISYLKIINKNQINIIEYDLVNKLIELKIGDNIILEFDKEENSLFNIRDYRDEIYIQEIIKKCILKKKVNILDYILFKLNKSIIDFDIDVISIYLLNIPKKNNNIDCEFKYIDLLKIIVKYFTKQENKVIIGLENKKFSLLEYCIENNLYLSANVFIQNSIDINISNKKDFTLLLNCLEKSNTIIFEYILNSNPNSVSYFLDKLNIFTYLFLYWEKKIIKEPNILFIFLHKILYLIYSTNIGTNLINYQDEFNELVGFKILNTNELNSINKIILIKLMIEHINPLEINNFINKNISKSILNYPLIIHSMLVDELEITFILLNNLLKNGLIKKNNTGDVSRIYDYYLLDTHININFIPIIFKYIKDNRNKCNGFEELTNLQLIQENIIIEGIRSMTILLLICIKFVLLFIIIKSNRFINICDNSNETSNSEDNLNMNHNKKLFLNKITNNEDLNNNKYIEITISSDNNQNLINTLTNSCSNTNNIFNLNNINNNSVDHTNHTNILNKYKHKIFKQSKEKDIHKNIWVSSTSNNIKKNNITQLSDSINLSDSVDSSESKKSYNCKKNNINGLYKIGMLDNNSDISDSDVLFDYN